MRVVVHRGIKFTRIIARSAYPRRCSPRRRSARQHEIEFASFALDAGARDRAAVRYHDFAGDGQAQAGTGPLILIRRAVEALEDPPDAVRVNARRLLPHTAA